MKLFRHGKMFFFASSVILIAILAAPISAAWSHYSGSGEHVTTQQPRGPLV